MLRRALAATGRVARRVARPNARTSDGARHRLFRSNESGAVSPGSGYSGGEVLSPVVGRVLSRRSYPARLASRFASQVHRNVLGLPFAVHQERSAGQDHGRAVRRLPAGEARVRAVR